MGEPLESKIALVTGAGSGIGRATALALARAGAKVVVSGRRTIPGEETTHMIAEAGGEAIFVRADVSSTSEVEQLVRTTVDAYGRLDCAFNNAGIPSPSLSLTADLSEAEWDAVLDTNLKGTWRCLRAEIPQLVAGGGGSIVNCASIFGLVSSPLGVSAYVASKHAIIGLTKSAALEYARKSVRVNAVCPGFVETALVDIAMSTPELRERVVALHPLGRIGQPAEVAEAVVWLCSDASSFVTGTSMVLDGGYVGQ